MTLRRTLLALALAAGVVSAATVGIVTVRRAGTTGDDVRVLRAVPATGALPASDGEATMDVDDLPMLPAPGAGLRAGAAPGEGEDAEGEPGDDEGFVVLISEGDLIVGGSRVVWPVPTDRNLLRVPAAPDMVDGIDEPVAVAPGRPPTMELSAYAAAGHGGVQGTVELVGRRKPKVEEGVPVSITGRVVEEDGETPVAGAEVILTSTFYVRRYFYDHHLQEVARVRTDADGVYTVERLNIDPVHFGRGGNLYATVTAEGHAPALAVGLSRVTPGVANRLRDVALARATHRIEGRVLDMWENQPVAGATIYATGHIDPVTYPKDERPALFVGAPKAITDEDGRFVLEGLGAGLQVLSAHGGDDCIGREQVTLREDGDGETATVVMRTRWIRGRIEGRVVDGMERPVALVTVDGGDNSTHSFADGAFVLENFRGDLVDVTFRHPDWPAQVVRQVPDGTTGLTVWLQEPRPRIVLEVTSQDTGAPVTRIHVAFVTEDGSALPDDTSPWHTAKDGRHGLRLPDGAAGAIVSAVDATSLTLPLAGRVDGESVPVLLAPR